MVSNHVLSLVLLAVGALAQDDAAINPSQAPPEFCLAVDVVSNSTRSAPESERVRISPGVICSRDNATNGNCEIEAGGFFELSTLYNETDRSESRLASNNQNNSRAIDWSIYNVTGDYGPFFSHQSFGAVANTTLTFTPDSGRNSNGNSSDSVSAAYATFAGIYQCIVASFSDCPDGLGIDNGTVIETCYPQKRDDRIQDIGIFAGQPVVEFTNVTYAASIPENQYKNRPEGLVTSGAELARPGNAAMALLIGAVALVSLA